MNMTVRVTKFFAVALTVLSITLSTGTVGAQHADILLADKMPTGVAFTTLATAEGSPSRSHVDALRLDRITVGCGQVTGKIFGVEQIAYVEYGQVEVRDWATGEPLATLSAGDSFAPTKAEQYYYLASTKGHQGSVLRFSNGAAGTIGADLPDVMFKTTDCASGATTEMNAKPATIETIYESKEVGDTTPGDTFTLYVGSLSVDPGASMGQPYAEGSDVVRYAATGSGLILTLTGGFGNGSVGTMGALVTGPEVGPDQTAPMIAGAGVALENFGTQPTVALVFGALPIDAPILTTT